MTAIQVIAFVLFLILFLGFFAWVAVLALKR